jgi:hypothetical protein
VVYIKLYTCSRKCAGGVSKWTHASVLGCSLIHSGFGMITHSAFLMVLLLDVSISSSADVKLA